MPRDIFKKQFKKHDGHLSRIANYFNVSTAAAYVRAKGLGLNTDDNI